MPRRFTILADGPTDRALRPIVMWVLNRIPFVSEQGFIVEFSVARNAEDPSLRSRVKKVISEFPCDVLFIHRDAERESVQSRLTEIEMAVQHQQKRFVPIIPVRMTEAWLLTDSAAIRRAADNPNGSVQLDIPTVSRLESLPDPKNICNSLLIRASEKTGRRRHKFARDSELAARRTRIAELTGDFSPLMQLSAFRSFYEQVETVCNRL